MYIQVYLAHNMNMHYFCDYTYVHTHVQHVHIIQQYVGIIPESVLVLWEHPLVEVGPAWSLWGWTHSELEGRTCRCAPLGSTSRSPAAQSYGCCTRSHTMAPSRRYDLWTFDQWQPLVRTVGSGTRAAAWWGLDGTQWWGSHPIGRRMGHSATCIM